MYTKEGQEPRTSLAPAFVQSPTIRARDEGNPVQDEAICSACQRLSLVEQEKKKEVVFSRNTRPESLGTRILSQDNAVLLGRPSGQKGQ